MSSVLRNSSTMKAFADQMRYYRYVTFQFEQTGKFSLPDQSYYLHQEYKRSGINVD